MGDQVETSDGLGWSFWLAMAALVIGFVAGQALSYMSTSGYIGTLERMESHYREKFQYYFDGANKRDYIELCRLSDGTIDVVYSDECSE